MRSPGDNLDHPFVIKAAYSGSAAANIEGQTCHSAFSLDFGGNFLTLGDKKRDKLRTIMRHLIIVIIN